ncbi:MAG: type I-B CRISPR-associated protein Cas7/Cst2/DevR [Firmicutes bacterium]|nr:type I-B CRISPR-associated protein Cas7/Cst2/DevR [Bacillota bacterium]
MVCKGITVTALFESAALNRDEKVGGNVPSIKKLARGSGVYSYFSRQSIRHHLFTTLQYRYNDWKPAPVTLAGDRDNKVIQFAFPEANILDYPEMDLFGYMNTDASGRPTRKAPLGITKAVSIEPWQADMSFGANHDMVARYRQRGEKAEPNPYVKEEHYSFYRVSFTLDLYRFGYDEYLYKNDKKEPKVPDALKELIDTRTLPVKKDEDVKKIASWAQNRISDLGEDVEWRKYDSQGEIIGLIGVSPEIGRAVFVVADAERRKRLAEIVSVLKNGMMLHASGESYGIVPQFLIIGCLTIPVPVFNSFVTLKDGAIDAMQLNRVLTDNDYILRAFVSSTLPFSKEWEAKAREKLDQEISIDTIVNCCLTGADGGTK